MFIPLSSFKSMNLRYEWKKVGGWISSEGRELRTIKKFWKNYSRLFQNSSCIYIVYINLDHEFRFILTSRATGTIRFKATHYIHHFGYDWKGGAAMKAICFAIMKQLWPATRPVPAYDREYLRALRRQRQPQQRKCKFIVIRLLDSDPRLRVNTIYICVCVCVSLQNAISSSISA